MSSLLLRIPYQVQLNLRRWAVGRAYRLRTAWSHLTPSNAQSYIQSPGKVLVIIAGLIGDSVMCAPVLAEARKTWPEAHITLMCRRNNRGLFSACPDFDALYQADGYPFSIRDRRTFAVLREWVATNQFDIAIILLGDDFAALLASLCIPVRVGCRGTLLESCLTHTFDCATPRTWGPHEKLNSLRTLGFKISNTVPRLKVSNAARIESRKILSSLGVRAETPYAVIHPYGSQPARWWPLNRVDELSRALTDRMCLTSILIGGPDIREHAAPCMPRHCVYGVGAFSTEELLAVIENSAVVVSTDSGPFHIAGALARPTVGLFRASRPEHLGRYPNTMNVVGTHSDCGRSCTWNRCRYHQCRQMMSIGTSQVLEKIEMLIPIQCIHGRDTDPAGPIGSFG